MTFWLKPNPVLKAFLLLDTCQTRDISALVSGWFGCNFYFFKWREGKHWPVVFIGFWKSLTSFSMDFPECCLQDEPYFVLFWHTTAFHIDRNHNRDMQKIPHAFPWCLLVRLPACLPGLQNLYNLLFPRIFFCIEAVELLRLADSGVNMSSQRYSWEKVIIAFHFRYLYRCLNKGRTPKVYV